MNRFSIAAAGVAALLALSACGSSGGGGSTSGSNPAGGSEASMSMSMPASAPAGQSAGSGSQASSSQPKITIKNFGYSGTLTVKAGAKVTVVNEDSTAHTLTDKKTHKFDTGNVAAGGGTGTFTAPTAPGSYPFGCTYHPEMSGTLVVTG